MLTFVIRMKNIVTILFGCLACAVGLSAQPRLCEDNIPEVVKAMTTEEKACLVVGFNSG